MDGEMASSARRAVVARYFEMWNTGDSSAAAQILCPGWADRAHPEVSGPDSMRQAIVHSRICGSDVEINHRRQRVAARFVPRMFRSDHGLISPGSGAMTAVAPYIGNHDPRMGSSVVARDRLC
jgi:hypothetical protein